MPMKQMRRRPATALLVLMLCIGADPALAEQKPLWEAGAGIGVLDFPDYRGSDERSTLVRKYCRTEASFGTFSAMERATAQNPST